jgi:hypothetical protein
MIVAACGISGRSVISKPPALPGVRVDRQGGVDDHPVAVWDVFVVRGGRAYRGQSCLAEPFA